MTTQQPSSVSLRLVFLSALICISVGGRVLAQPAGGRPSSDAPKKPTTRASAPSSRTTPSTTNTRVSRPANTSPASIDGKWWTSGNDFGDSEVVFTQSGSNVSGVIHYADGRSGTVNGTMVGKRLQMTFTNSSGDGGSGWLELSWNNFLGGPWHNQRVRDGSWTLMRVEGKWCFGGSRSRIRTVTHNARGDLFMTTEDGSEEGGRLEGPWLFLESDGMTIKGEMDFRSTRVNWSSGFFWSWCGRN